MFILSLYRRRYRPVTGPSPVRYRLFFPYVELQPAWMLDMVGVLPRYRDFVPKSKG